MSQKKKSNISFGPGAPSLILIFVALSMSALAMLALMNSRNDVKLSERSAEAAGAVYTLNARAEETYAALDALIFSCGGDLEALEAALPEGVQMEEDLLSWTESDELRTLNCALRVLPADGEKRAEWVQYSLTAVTEEEGIWEE